MPLYTGNTKESRHRKQMQIKTFILVKCPIVQVFQSKRAAFSAHGEKGAVAQLPKQSHVQSECHDSEMLHQVTGANAKPQPSLCI